MRERGLKSTFHAKHSFLLKSLPMRERGLKYVVDITDLSPKHVAPHAGAWIEMDDVGLGDAGFMSLPMRERGLKCNGRVSVQ